MASQYDLVRIFREYYHSHVLGMITEYLHQLNADISLNQHILANPNKDFSMCLTFQESCKLKPCDHYIYATNS